MTTTATQVENGAPWGSDNYCHICCANAEPGYSHICQADVRARRMTVGAKIRRLRGSLRRSILAWRIGVASQVVCHWEHGCIEPKAPILHRLARALGVTVDDLREE